MCCLADERDGVDADPLAAQVVAVGLAHRPERDLGDLRAATDDDDPLAEDAVEGPGQVDGPDVLEPVEGLDQRVLGDALDLELDLGERRVALDAADRRECPDPATDLGDARRDRRDRRPGVDDVEADRGGRGPAGLRRPSASAERAAPGGAGSEVVDRQRVGFHPAGRVVLLERERQRRERLAGRGRVGGREHQRAVGVLGDADDAGDVDPALAERRRRRGRASPADRRA